VHQIELEIQNAELSQARGALEKSLEQYTDLYDFAPVGYFTLDGNGVVGAVNLAGAGLLGVERSRLLGRRFGQFVAVPDRPAFSAFLARAFSVLGGGVCRNCELALLGRDSEQLVVQIQAVADVSGQQCRIVLIDITARKKAETALREIKERESRSLESKLLLSEERFFLFMDNLPGAAFIKDSSGVTCSVITDARPPLPRAASRRSSTGPPPSSGLRNWRPTDSIFWACRRTP
jgi:PAS domain S-box-containing protein